MATTAHELRQEMKSRHRNDFESLLQKPVRFDAEAWHVMDQRDNQLIADNVLHGETSAEYVYSFNVKGSPVQGISVIGARALMAQYGGLQTRIKSSIDKQGSLLIFKSFDPIHMSTEVIPQIEDEPDFYEVILEIKDVKTGNSLEVRKRENKQEFRRDGTPYDRPHYDVIAESKAFRNGVLAILPQEVIDKFKQKALKQGKVSNETTKTDLIDRCMRFGTKQGIPLDRQAMQQLTYQEIMGLGEAAKDGDLENAAQKAGVLAANNTLQPEDENVKPPPAANIFAARVREYAESVGFAAIPALEAELVTASNNSYTTLDALPDAQWAEWCERMIDNIQQDAKEQAKAKSKAKSKGKAKEAPKEQPAEKPITTTTPSSQVEDEPMTVVQIEEALQDANITAELSKVWPHIQKVEDQEQKERLTNLLRIRTNEIKEAAK